MVISNKKIIAHDISFNLEEYLAFMNKNKELFKNKTLLHDIIQISII